MDNGTIRHVTNNFEYFLNLKKFQSPIAIQVAGQETLEATGSGTIQVIHIVNINKELAGELISTDVRGRFEVKFQKKKYFVVFSMLFRQSSIWKIASFCSKCSLYFHTKSQFENCFILNKWSMNVVQKQATLFFYYYFSIFYY